MRHDANSIRERINYAFDTMMTRGPTLMIGWLTLFMALVIIISALILHTAKAAPDDHGVVSLMWVTWLRTLDPGVIADDHGSRLFLSIMLVSTLLGILSVSMLVGILTTGLQSRIEKLRKGRSRVLESGHTVVLGWSEQVYTIVSELVIANENQRRPCVAILADKDKVSMEEAIRSKIGSTKNTRIVCRSGNPFDAALVGIMSVESARSIIVIAPDIPFPDAEVIKILLVLRHTRAGFGRQQNVVAMIRDPRNIEAARIAGGPDAEVILAGEIVAKMTAQTSLQPGLSGIYQELLDFDGDEIYFQAETSLVGKTLAESLVAYETSCVIGVFTADGEVLINPPHDRLIAEGDRLIAISEDDDPVVVDGRFAGPDEQAIKTSGAAEKPLRRILMLGWNWRAPVIIAELADYLAPGSSVTVVRDPAFEYRGASVGALSMIKVVEVDSPTTSRNALVDLDLAAYDSVIILSYSDHLEPQAADAQTIVTLLHCRSIAEENGLRFSLTSEMRDTSSRDLAAVAGADDYIVSDQVISLLLTCVSENRHLASVFSTLFSRGGSEIYLRPADLYVELGVETDFYTVVVSASRRGEIAIGYRQGKRSAVRDKCNGVRINPDKSDRVRFAAGDSVVVVAVD